VKNYIQDSDIIDVGASIGDSLNMLDEDTYRKVMNYELIPDMSEVARKAATRLRPEKMWFCSADFPISQGMSASRFMEMGGQGFIVGFLSWSLFQSSIAKQND
jgi:hypothetical protein